MSVLRAASYFSTSLWCGCPHRTEARNNFIFFFLSYAAGLSTATCMQILRGATNYGEKMSLSLVTPNYYFLSDGYCPVVFKAIMYFCLINTGLRSSSICHKIIKQSLHRQGGIFWQDSWQQSDRELSLLKLSLDRIFSLKHSYSSIWYSVALGTVHLKEFIQY